MTARPIVETEDLAIAADFDADAPREDLAATAESDPEAKIEFYVQMRSWTIRDMEDLIIQAAATQMIRSFGGKKFSQIIETRAIEAITAKADEKIAAVSDEIIDQPLTPQIGDKAPVTMREFIGLYAKEYLTERVDRDGKPSKGGWGTTTYTRAQMIVMAALDRKFKNEIEKATNSTISEIQGEIRKVHAAILEEEKARIRAAVAKFTA
ncbi:MAG: hypothetical protein VKL39_24495 [Leptolyngbyaceae bacterium]|nr:hypothetical protein [Leptolyngbyaceae bacterium]